MTPTTFSSDPITPERDCVPGYGRTTRPADPVAAWERYAEKARPRREVNAAGATTWFNWTQYRDHGPNESVFSDVGGRTVVELGSGSGSNLAHLATLGAYCIGVDLAPSREVSAARTWANQPHLDFVTADVVDYLTDTPATFDVVYSVFGATWFIDPAILLPLVRKRMTPGGVLAFSHLLATEPRTSSGRTIAGWHYPAEQWVQLLTAEGFDASTAEIISAPTANQIGTLLVRGLAA